MPRHRNRNIFSGVASAIGTFMHDPLGKIAHTLGSAVREMGHATGGAIHDIVGGAASGLNPLVKQVGASTTDLLAKGVSPVLKTAGEAVSKDLTALGTPLQALSLPLMVAAGVAGIFLVTQFMNR